MAIELIESRLGALSSELSDRLKTLPAEDRDDFLATFLRDGFDDLESISQWVKRRES